MRVAVLAAQAPLAAVPPPAAVAARLCRELGARGHEAVAMPLPFDASAPAAIVDQILAMRLLTIEGVDRVIALAFPVHYVPHEDRVVWALAPHDEVTGALPPTVLGRRVRRAVLAAERAHLASVRALYAPSAAAAARLRADTGRDVGVLAVPGDEDPWEAAVAALTA